MLYALHLCMILIKNADTKSAGTVAQSPFEAAGSNTFLAPLSKYTYSVLAKISPPPLE